MFTSSSSEGEADDNNNNNNNNKNNDIGGKIKNEEDDAAVAMDTTTTNNNDTNEDSMNNDDNNDNNNNNNNNSSTDDKKLPAYTFDPSEEDFTEIDGVEWGPRKGEDGYDTDQECVPRPKPKPTDACLCVIPHHLMYAEDRDDIDPEDIVPCCCVDDTCVNFACQEECYHKNCPGREYCGNRRLQKKKYAADVRVFDCGPRKGRGLRILGNVKKGDLIHEYTGRAIKATKIHRLFQKYKHDRRLYIMSLNNDVVLDARTHGGIARFINHSCEPNCQVQRWKVKGLLRAAIIATQDIEAGTELTFDYQWQRMKGRAPTKCYCGSASCRGTLEMPKTMEISGLEKEWEGHWEDFEGTNANLKQQFLNSPTQLINRTIRVHSSEHDEYFIGEVTGYDDQTGKHSVLYRHDMTEDYEDLSKEKWMLLNEQVDQRYMMIARKMKKQKVRRTSGDNNNDNGIGGDADGTGLGGTGADADDESPTKSSSRLLLQAAEQLHGSQKFRLPQKHYIYVQTPIKEGLYNKHLIERCERNCSVVVTAEQFAKPPLPPSSEEEEEKYAALEQSLDGTIWKISVSGSDVARAHNILEKNVAYLERIRAETGGGGVGGGMSFATGDTASVSTITTSTTNITASANAMMMGMGGVDSNSTVMNDAAAAEVCEIILPREIVDTVKRKQASWRDKCNSRCATISFAPSESKSKQFARLLIQGNLTADVVAAQDIVWRALVQLCCENNKNNGNSTPPCLPVAHPRTTLPRHLGLLGGTLTAKQFQLLCQTNNDSHNTNLSMDANQDLRRIPFFSSFETTYKCTVWVQADADKGRVDSHNRIVGESNPQGPRKVYLGCPNGIQDAQRLFGLLQTRATELERGVQYLYLGKDRVYQPLMMSRNFFNFVEKVTGASVQVDTLTGDFLRMDGRGVPLQRYDLTGDEVQNMGEVDRASLAEELVRLQIELYRGHCIREQSWVFGRDWTSTATQSVPPPGGSGVVGAVAAAAAGGDLNDTKASSSFGQLDTTTAAHGAVEIPSVVAHLGHGGNVAAHAAIILYRFVSVMDCSIRTQWKVREAVLACIFLANKCQKVNKWKRLEVVLEAAYETFYPGTKFDKDSEGVLVLEERVIAAEKDILQTLQYDIFWRDIECIVSAATGDGRMKADQVERVFDFAFSGPVLGAGAELWLKYGVEYVFAASAAFFDTHNDLLDHLLPALGVIPLKVFAATELLAKSAKLGRSSSGHKDLRAHPLLEGGRDRMENCIPRIREACVASMNKMTARDNGSSSLPSSSSRASVINQRYELISEQGRRRYTIGGIPRQFVKDHVVPVVDAVATESACNVYIGESSPEETGREEIIFDGPWRAVAVAEHLLRTKADGPVELARAVDVSSTRGGTTKIQAKIEPGCVDANDIQTSDGWEGTIQSHISNQTLKGRRIGGKSCIAGKVSESALRKSGLQWWIPLKSGSSPSGSINDMFLVRENEKESLRVLVELAKAVAGKSSAFPKLASLSNEATNGSADRFAAVSLQQWPSEKVGNKELEKGKSKKKTMQMGFSAAALQEMQLLTQLHGPISLPFGHPNFVLPVGIAVAVGGDTKDSAASPAEEEKNESSLSSMGDPMFSLFRSSEENEKVAEKDKKVKCLPHLLLNPTPFVLHRFTSKKHISGFELRANKALMAAWFHDLLSALVHCHSNHVVMRTIQPDQIVVDHNGTAKFGGLYRCTVISQEGRVKPSELWKPPRSSKKKGKKDKDDNEDFSNNPFVAPETLLGAPKHSKESDVWAVGSLLANLLLGKPLFVGKDRNSLLTAQFKIVGTPARNNFEEAAKFPHYSKPIKKYPRGVEKALGHMLKDESSLHHKAIDLIARMLHLDPRRRCTASEALSHDYMLEYMESCGSPAFRDEYVSQWMQLKEQSLSSSRSSSRDSKKSKQMLSKRKAMLMAASRPSDDDADDLYDIEDLLEQPTKKAKS